MGEEQRSKVERLMAELNGRAKKPILFYANALPPKEFLPSGSLSLDRALGGGWVRGQASMVWGPEGAGKSTVAAITAAAVQRAGGVVVWIAAENRVDLDWLGKNGVDVDQVVFIFPDQGEDMVNFNPMSAEQALNHLVAVLKAGLADLVILDSVAVLTPAAEIEAKEGMEKKSYGGVSAIMSQLQRVVGGSGLLLRSRAHVMFLNQVREKIGGNPNYDNTDTPGGHALKHMVSQSVRLRTSTSLKTPVTDPATQLTYDWKYGVEVVSEVVKNSVAPPFKKARFAIKFDTGFDPMEELLVAAVGLKVVTRAGAWYQYVDRETGESMKWQGTDKAVTALRDNPEVAQQIRSLVVQMINEAEGTDLR